MHDKYSETARESIRLESDAYATTRYFVETNTNESTPTVPTSERIRPNCVNIPVAVHQDAHLIYKAMAQYAKQKECQPITALLHLNAPTSEPTQAFDVARDEISRARTDFPQLDIRSFQTQYDAPRISKIRSDLWKTALKTALDDASVSPERDIIGYNHDIDTVYLPQNYFAAVEKWYIKRKRNMRLINASLDLPEDRSIILPYAITHAAHATMSDTHPNSSAVIAWSNLVSRLDGSSYEAAYIFPFARYAKSGGFDERRYLHETKPITDNSQDDLQPYNATIPSLPLVTSPRRYLERLHHAGLDSIWSEYTFSATDACRETTPPPDISTKKARAHIRESIDETFYATAVRHAHRRISERLKLHDFECITAPGDFPDELSLGTSVAYRAEEYRLIDRTIQLGNRALRQYLGNDTLTMHPDHTSQTLRAL